MKFQNPVLNFERTHERTEGQAQTNMPLQLSNVGSIKKKVMKNKRHYYMTGDNSVK